jgi:hypothetical protein
MIAGVAALAATSSLTACGAAESGSRQAQKPSGTAVEAPSASAPDEYEDDRIVVRASNRANPRCPTSLLAGRFAPARITEAIRREVPRVYADMSAQGEQDAWRDYSVIGVFSLDVASTHGAPAAWRRTLRRYGEAAGNVCGGTIARRSWVALIHFPRAQNALVGEGVAFLARTRAGWRIWATTVASVLPALDLVRGPTSANTNVASRNCDLDAGRRTRRTVLVHLQKENYDRGRYFPRDLRIYVPIAKAITDVEAWSPLRTALLRLMEGETRRERRLGCVSIFSNDAHVLRAVKIVDGQAVVDFHRRAFQDELAFVSTSHAGAVFVTQLNLTIFQFPNVHSIRYEFDGNCKAFGDYMQAGQCMIFRRAQYES